MRPKKKIDFINLTKTDDDTCDSKKIEVKQFKWCTCMESISISVPDVSKQPADSSSLPSQMNSGKGSGGSVDVQNAGSVVSSKSTSRSNDQTEEDVNGDDRKIVPDSSDSKFVDVKPR